MSKKTKGKASANSMAKAAPAKPAAIPAKPTPIPPKPPSPTVPATTAPKVAPAPTKLAPQKPETGKSEKLRKEWQNLETWLKVRRAERDKKLNEARAKAKPAAMGPQSRYRSNVRSSPPVDVSALELKLNMELAVAARAEWERRLSAQKLNEEDWIDITPEEMKAVELAFTVPEEPSKPAEKQPNLSSGIPPFVNLNNTNSNSAPIISPGGWTVHPSAVPTPSGSGLRQNAQTKTTVSNLHILIPRSSKLSISPILGIRLLSLSPQRVSGVWPWVEALRPLQLVSNQTPLCQR